MFNIDKIREFFGSHPHDAKVEGAQREHKAEDSGELKKVLPDLRKLGVTLGSGFAVAGSSVRVDADIGEGKTRVGEAYDRSLPRHKMMPKMHDQAGVFAAQAKLALHDALGIPCNGHLHPKTGSLPGALSKAQQRDPLFSNAQKEFWDEVADAKGIPPAGRWHE